MNALTPLPACGMTLVLGLPDHEPLLEMVARLALGGPLQVVVGGNRFNAHRLARLMRRHTVRVDETLARVQVARPFTCYQTITLLAQTGASTPLLVLDLLVPFTDDSLSDTESFRLLALAVAHLRRCALRVPVLVTAQPVLAPARQGLTAVLQKAADQVIQYQPPPAPVQLALAGRARNNARASGSRSTL